VLIFIVFFLLVYGLTFLIADATIFGCDTIGYLQKPYNEEWEAWVQETGILKIRQRLLRYRFFQQLFKCYFCLGFWCGMLIHVFCYHFFGTYYFLYHPATVLWCLGGLLAAALLGAAGSAIIDTKIIGRSS
jgi:hypothetical protein